MTDQLPDRSWSPDMVAELVGDRTRLDMELEAERASADRLASLVDFMLRGMAEHEQAGLVTPAAPWFTVGDLARAELARHRGDRAAAVQREQA